MFDDDADVLAAAEQVLARAALHVREEDAAAALQRTTGLRLAPLWPPSTVIQVVALDGVCIGRVRREYPHVEPARWIAVPPGRGPRLGPFRSAQLAAEALAGAVRPGSVDGGPVPGAGEEIA